MKASTKSSFSLDSKYSRVRNIIIVYVWYLEDLSKTVTYALTYNEALNIAEKLGWTKTKSWKSGSYSTSHPGKELCKLLDPYKMTSEKWWNKITRIENNQPIGLSTGKLKESYKEMASNKEREAQAGEWVEALAGDLDK